MKKEVKLNNVIFPIWMMWIFPPLALLALIGNFVIDSLVILAAFAIFKVVKSTGLSMGQLYKKSILKVWIFGFLGDIVGAIMLFVTMLILETGEGANDIISAICYNPFSNIIGLIIVVAAVVLAVLLIWTFNYYIVFNRLIDDSKIRMKVAITIAIVTMPWTYLIPTQWLYKGF